MLLLGNDIVDLNNAGMENKHLDARFVQRVFTEKERSAIFASLKPDLTLWMFWAAKETAYKITSKIFGPPIFSHKKFENTGFKQLSKSKYITKTTYQKWIFPIEITAKKECIHAVGHYAADEDSADFNTKIHVHQITPAEINSWKDKNLWSKHFTRKELDSIHNEESALIRLLCKNSISSTLNINSAQLQIVRPFKVHKAQPPYILLDNHSCEIDISLSHHGSWLGWCFSKKKEAIHQYP